MNKKFLIVIVALIILTIGIGVGAWHNWQNPAVVARQFVEARDLETFKKCVDLDKLIERAAEEILSAQINSTVAPNAYSMDELQLQYDKLKPDFVNSAHAAVEEYISTGKVIFPNAMTEAQKFFKKSGATACEIKSISKPQKDGNAKVVTVIFYNSLMKFNFELELELAPVDENMIKNAGGAEYGFSQNLDITLKADVKFDKPLAKVVGNVILGDDAHKSSRAGRANFQHNKDA